MSGIESFSRDHLSDPNLISATVEGKRNLGVSEWQGNNLGILTSLLIEAGREGLLKANEDVSANAPPHDVLIFFQGRAPKDFAAVLIGCMLKGVDEAIWDGEFSLRDFTARLRDATSATAIKINDPPKDQEVEAFDLKILEEMTAAASQDKTLVSFFDNEGRLLPESLKSYVSKEIAVGPSFWLYFDQILRVYEKLALRLLE